MSRPITRVAVLFGGRSGEHEVSRKSATAILKHLDPDRYAALPVLISRDGSWSVESPDATPASRTTSGEPLWSIAEMLPQLQDVDVVFPALHGPYGEDGTIQSMLEMLDIPFVGNGALASALGMDKEYTKKILKTAGLSVAKGVVLRGEGSSLTEAEKADLGLPVFVKPARAGSSLGISKVDSWDQLDPAIEAARRSDPKVLVEAAVHGREIDLGVLEMPDGEIRISPSLEIHAASSRAFFDYGAKYSDSTTVFQIPAHLDEETSARLAEVARKAFEALDCSGLLRVDCFVTEDGTPVVNEVNTFPGFTTASQYPQMWQAADLGYPELLDILIRTALCQAPDRPRFDLGEARLVQPR